MDHDMVIMKKHGQNMCHVAVIKKRNDPAKVFDLQNTHKDEQTVQIPINRITYHEYEMHKKHAVG